jgi:signal transduction histidine kinase
LTISRRIIEAHGGQLTAQSEPGRGSTFTFTIPLGDAQAVAPPAAESGAKP